MAQHAELERFLNKVLSQRGPGQLPYKEDTKWLVRQHIIDLAEEMPSLAVKSDQYAYGNGRTVNALREQGTIPMYYQGNKYNIPVAIWLVDDYPHAPPVVYVEPTPGMIIKPQHSFVDSSGIVDVAYLREWAYQSSNLVDLCFSLGISFGEDPPLFSKPPGWTPPPSAAPSPPPPQQQPFHNPMVRPLGHNPYANPYNPQATNAAASQPPPPTQADPYANPFAFQNPYIHQQQPPPPPQHHQPNATPLPPPPPQRRPLHSGTLANPAELAFRKAALSTLQKRLQASIAAENEKTCRRLASLHETAKELDVRHATLSCGLRAIEAERTALERNVAAMTAKTAELDLWLAKHEEKAKSAGESAFKAEDLEAAIVPADTLSKQALQAAAEDMAIEDTLYALERGLQAGILEPEAYLKQVRKLCRKQFFPRALGHKVAEMQQAQRMHGELRAQHPAHGELSLPHGDGWVHTSGHFQRPTAAPSTGGWSNPLVMEGGGKR